MVDTAYDEMQATKRRFGKEDKVLYKTGKM